MIRSRSLICLVALLLMAALLFAAAGGASTPARAASAASTTTTPNKPPAKKKHKKKKKKKPIALAGAGTGGSTATCTPSPCTPGVMPDWTHITVDDGSGTKTKTMEYKIYRPNGLTNSAVNKAPAVVWLDEQLSPGAIQSWESLAVANRFVLVVYKPGSYRVGSKNGAAFWEPVTIPWQPAPVPNCGATGQGRCDDKPGFLQFLKMVETTQNIDTKKVFVTGASKGAAFTEELMCSPTTNKLFRGFGVVSGTLFSSTATQDPATNTCRSFNTDSSVAYINGENDNYEGRSLGGRYLWGRPEAVAYVAQHYGCGSKPVTTLFGSAGSLRRDLYGSCARRYRAVELISVPNGGHAYALDGMQGFNSEAELWSFWASH